jgi:hypothetical protein
MPRVEVIVGVDAKDEKEFQALAAAAESAGLQIHPTGRLVSSGVLAGTIDRDAIEALRKVRGVVDVEESRSVKTLRDKSDPH